MDNSLSNIILKFCGCVSFQHGLQVNNNKQPRALLRGGVECVHACMALLLCVWRQWSDNIRAIETTRLARSQIMERHVLKNYKLKQHK